MMAQKQDNNTPISAAEALDDSWRSLRRFTDARIGLGRAGCSVPTRHLLAFQMDHANARDAVHIPLDSERVLAELNATSVCESEPVQLQTQAADRATYLQRPDLGRKLAAESAARLRALAPQFSSQLSPQLAPQLSSQVPSDKAHRAVIVIADGLSSTAVQAHGAQLCRAIQDELAAKQIASAPVCLVTQGRVAVGDEIAACLGADILIVLIGERPGLSSPDSLGIYYTFRPEPGLLDDRRNCISNIRPAGLSFTAAREKLGWLIEQSLRLQLSGVQLKDESDPVAEQLPQPALSKTQTQTQSQKQAQTFKLSPLNKPVK